MKNNARVRFVSRFGLTLALTLSVTGACSKPGSLETKGAVRAAIEAHLKRHSNLLLENMTVDVDQVKFDGGRATAEVLYRSKNSPDLVVRVRYLLRKEKDHWAIDSSSPMSGANPHSASGPAPAHSAEAAPPQASH